jgi:hypothetical protein
LETLLRGINFTWLLSLLTWEIDVDGLACNRQSRGQSFLSGATLSHHAAMGDGAFPGGVKPCGLDIRWSVDCLGTCVTKFYME